MRPVCLKNRAHLFGAILFGAPRPVNYCTLVFQRFRASISLPQITPIWEDFWTNRVQSLLEGAAENWTAFCPSAVPLKYSKGADSRLRSTSRADHTNAQRYQINASLKTGQLL